MRCTRDSISAFQVPVIEVHLEPKYGTAEKLVHKNSSMKTTGSRTRVEEERNRVHPEDVRIWRTGKVLCNKSEIRRNEL